MVLNCLRFLPLVTLQNFSLKVPVFPEKSTLFLAFLSYIFKEKRYLLFMNNFCEDSEPFHQSRGYLGDTVDLP